MSLLPPAIFEEPTWLTTDDGLQLEGLLSDPVTQDIGEKQIVTDTFAPTEFMTRLHCQTYMIQQQFWRHANAVHPRQVSQ